MERLVPSVEAVEASDPVTSSRFLWSRGRDRMVRWNRIDVRLIALTSATSLADIDRKSEEQERDETVAPSLQRRVVLAHRDGFSLCIVQARVSFDIWRRWSEVKR